jgi:hypothetical protein
MQKTSKIDIAERKISFKEYILKDIEDFVSLLNSFINTYSEIGNVSQYLIHSLRVKGWKIVSLIKLMSRLHNVHILKKYYTYTYQILKCFSNVRDMDMMIGLLNKEKSPRSLIKDFSVKRTKSMKTAYKKISKALDKYIQTTNEILEELNDPKYNITFKEIYKLFKIAYNEYLFAKISFLIEPSFELFDRLRAKLRNLKYVFPLFAAFFDNKNFFEEFIFLNNFQRSLNYFRDVRKLTEILSKTSLRVSRKKDFVESFLNSKRDIWKETVENFKERNVRIDNRMNTLLRELKELYSKIYPEDRSRYDKIYEEIKQIAKQHGININKNEKLANIAAKIYNNFDAANLIVKDPMEEFVLKCAAIIHDIGKSVSQESYYKASMEKFVTLDIHDIKTKEKLFIALVARYHTKSIPKYSHKWYTDLRENDKTTIIILSAFLRFSFALCTATNFSCDITEIRFSRDGIKILIDYQNSESITIDESDKMLLEKSVGFTISVELTSDLSV